MRMVVAPMLREDDWSPGTQGEHWIGSVWLAGVACTESFHFFAEALEPAGGFIETGALVMTPSRTI